MAIWAADTFESGTDGQVVTSPGGIYSGPATLVQYDNADPIHGSMSALAGPKGAGQTHYVQVSVAGKSSWRVRFYVRKENATQGTSNDLFLTVETSAGSTARLCQLVARQDAEKWVRVTDQTAAVRKDTTELWDQGSLWRIEVSWNGTQFTTDFYYGANLDGTTPDETGTFTKAVAGDPDRVLIGAGINTANAHQVTFDSVAFSDGEPIEPVNPSNPTGVLAHGWVGAQATDGFAATVKVSGVSTVALEAATSAAFTGSVTGSAATVDVNGYATPTISGLSPNTRYYWRCVSGGVPFGGPYRAHTAPAGQVGFTVGFGHCLSGTSGTAYGKIEALTPVAFLHMGDFHYQDSSATDVATHRANLELKIGQIATLKSLLANIPTYYVRSDHDGGGGDNADPNTAYTPNMQAVQQVAPGPVAGNSTDGLYGAWTLGRVRFIKLDTRNMNRSPAATTDGVSKTMLGATQKAWLKQELIRSEPLKVVLSDPPWVGSTQGNGTTDDKWPNYATERAEIADYITANNVNVLMVVGDYHASFVSSGANNAQGGFPVVAAGPFNQTGTKQGTEYDWALDAGGSAVQRFGTLEFTDGGDTIEVTYTAIDANTDATLYADSFIYDTTPVTGPQVWIWDGSAWSGDGRVWDGAGWVAFSASSSPPPVDPQIVWTEDWEGWPLGVPTVTPPVSQVDGSPQIVAGKVLQSGPSGNGVRFSTAGMPHWSLEFTVVTTGTQTANHYVASLRDMAGAYVGELSLRNTEKQIWNRINFGADTLGKSVWTYAQPGPSTLRIIYEWMDDEFVKCHMFYGANLNGTMPDETTIYDKTMASGILVGKRIGAVRLGNDSNDGLTQTFDNLTLRDLTL